MAAPPVSTPTNFASARRGWPWRPAGTLPTAPVGSWLDRREEHGPGPVPDRSSFFSFHMSPFGGEGGDAVQPDLRR
jgi:hypothetical protein